MTLAGLALAQAVKARALELGFDRVAIGPATLSHGADFTDVAQRFNLPGILPPGGDVGFLPAGLLEIGRAHV